MLTCIRELFLGPITLPKIENLNQLYHFPLFDKEPYLTLGNFSRESTFRKALEGTSERGTLRRRMLSKAGFPGLPGFEFSWGGYLHARVHTFMSGSMLPGSSPNGMRVQEIGGENVRHHVLPIV